MAERTVSEPVAAQRPAGFMAGRGKFLIGGVILLAAVAYLIISSLGSQQEYFKTVGELTANQNRYVGQKARISGVVLGDTIEYDGHTLSFVIANIPEGTGAVQDESWAQVLHTAATDPNAARVKVVIYDQPKPDLLKDEAQAIVTGKLGEDGVFYADELLLKCPTRYEEAGPSQAGG